MASNLASHVVENAHPKADDAEMSRKARPNPKTPRRPTQIKAWRKDRSLTLAKLSERLLELEDLEMSEAQLSRIERGEQPYSQDLLEALARCLRCEPQDLIMRTPAPDSIWSVWDHASQAERTEAVAYIETRRKMTGSNG